MFFPLFTAFFTNPTILVYIFLENTPKNTVNRLIERVLDVQLQEDLTLSGFDIAKTYANCLDIGCSSALIFALWEIEKHIKKLLNAKDKISVFFKNQGGKFICLEKVATSYMLPIAIATPMAQI